MCMKTNVICKECGIQFEKLNKEINRCKKKGWFDFCSRSCSATYRNSSMTKEYWQEQYRKHPVLKPFTGNRKNCLSPFKCFLNNGRASIKKYKDTMDITPEYLKELWENQRGICPYTGIRMILPESSSKYHAIKSLKKASLDRIDSSIGYNRGNVEFVCYAVNLGKNNHTKHEMIEFIKEIKNSQNILSITQAQPT